MYITTSSRQVYKVVGNLVITLLIQGIYSRQKIIFPCKNYWLSLVTQPPKEKKIEISK